MLKIDVKDYIANFPDFPKDWINFKDISPILKSPEVLRFVTMEIVKQCTNSDVIVWLDARGFIFGCLVASELKKPFVMLRKKWKLPGEVNQVSYWLEYWKDTLEIQKWSILQWQKISLIDDLLATWWTMKAAIDLVESLGWVVDNLSFVISLDEIELTNMKSRKQLEWYNINSLVSYN
jgi:adenine phosphoribosyltransferase